MNFQSLKSRAEENNSHEEESRQTAPVPTEAPQLSIGQQLDIMSKVKEIEYQNSLVMLSLEQYNNKYEKLKKEQIEQQKVQSNEIAELKQIVGNLQRANHLLNQNLKEEVGKWKDETNEQLEHISENIHRSITSKMKDVAIDTAQYLRSLAEIKVEAKRRFESFYDRKKWIDYIIFGYMGLTPIMFGLILWFMFKG